MEKVSFIIIAYNEERAIRRCLDSILVQEGLAEHEIIVIDDGSQDSTPVIVRDFAAKHPSVRLERGAANRGRGAARKTGIGLATGDFIAFVDADIILGPDWLKTCLKSIEGYDAVGGIAVPDGDVNYVYTLLGLTPKPVRPATIVTGANGFFRREVFRQVMFDDALSEGEDVALNEAMRTAHLKTRLIPTLIVEHRENKDFRQALSWLYRSGRGATRQLRRYHRYRLPDLAYFGLLATILLAGAVVFSGYQPALLLSPLIYVLLVSALVIARKFRFERRRAGRYALGILVFTVLLTSYFTGRSAGWLSAPGRAPRQNRTLLSFDLEGGWGMPHDAPYDIEQSVDSILGLLERYRVHGVFFAVGKLFEEHPALIRRIAAQGHTVALHGYSHRDFNGLDDTERILLERQLDEMNAKALELCGQTLKGFRAPYLLAPDFYSPALYAMLAGLGYEWTSNQEIRFVDEFLRPDRLPLRNLRGRRNWLTRAIFILLNLRILRSRHLTGGTGPGKTTGNLRWLLGGTRPFTRDGMLEIPVTAPLDCDLIGLPRPDEDTDESFIDYAVAVLTGGLRQESDIYVLTFHDWIIGSGNRLRILDEVLERLVAEKNVSFILPEEIS